MKRSFLLAFAVCSALAMAADGPARALVEQKEALVRRLLTDSPAVSRIAASDNAEAKTHFSLAGERHANAVKLIAASELARAESELNDAMWMIGKARQLVPDPMRRAIELRVQNAGLIMSIESLRASYETHLGRVRGLPHGAAPDPDERLRAISARFEEARSFIISEQVQEANAILQAVERDLMHALGAMLGTSTIRYAQRFETLAEEYAYEVQRNRSYVELLPIARATLKPAQEASALMDRYAAASHRLAASAQKAVARHDLRAALDSIRKATSYLQSALTAAGVAMPRDAATDTPTGHLQ